MRSYYRRGLPGNLPRVLPEGLGVRVDGDSWPVPGIFEWLAEQGPVEHDEMLKVFNCGIGMVLVTDKPDEVMAELDKAGEEAIRIGEVVRSDEPFTLTSPLNL